MFFRAGIIVLLLLCGCGKTGSQPADAGVDASGSLEKWNVDKGIYVIEKAGWAGTDKKVLEIILQNPDNKDVLKELYDKKVLIVIKEGIEVEIKERDGQMVRIQPLGKDISLWVFQGILKKK